MRGLSSSHSTLLKNRCYVTNERLTLVAVKADPIGRSYQLMEAT
jgi:hypothetical protein